MCTHHTACSSFVLHARVVPRLHDFLFYDQWMTAVSRLCRSLRLYDTVHTWFLLLRDVLRAEAESWRSWGGRLTGDCASCA